MMAVLLMSAALATYRDEAGFYSVVRTVLTKLYLLGNYYTRPLSMNYNNIYSIHRALFTCAAMFWLSVCASDAHCQALFGVSNTGTFNNVTSNLVTIDPATGTATIVGEIGSGVGFSTTGLAYDPLTETLFGNVGRELFSIDPNTGNATTLGLVELNSNLSFQLDRLVFDTSTDTLLGFDSNPGASNLVVIDPGNLSTDPFATAIGPTGFGNIEGLTFDESGTLFGINSGNELITIDPSTGTGTLVGTTSINSLEGLAFDPLSGNLLSTNNPFGIPGQLISIDPATGFATPIGPTGTGDSPALTFVSPAVVTVPEPTSAVALLFLGGLVVTARRKRANKPS